MLARPIPKNIFLILWHDQNFHRSGMGWIHKKGSLSKPAWLFVDVLVLHNYVLQSFGIGDIKLPILWPLESEQIRSSISERTPNKPCNLTTPPNAFSRWLWNSNPWGLNACSKLPVCKWVIGYSWENSKHQLSDQYIPAMNEGEGGPGILSNGCLTTKRFNTAQNTHAKIVDSRAT